MERLSLKNTLKKLEAAASQPSGLHLAKTAILIWTGIDFGWNSFGLKSGSKSTPVFLGSPAFI
jgi:hypothetical protein